MEGGGEEPTNGGFFKTNGKKFVTVIIGGISLTYMAVSGHIDPFYAVLYWFGVGGVSAGAISRAS